MKIKMAVNTVTIKPAAFEEKIKLIAKVGFSGVGLWMDDIQNYLKQNKKTKVNELLEDKKLNAVEMQLIRKWQYLNESEKMDAFRDAKKFFSLLHELKLNCPVVLLPSEEEGQLKEGIKDFKQMCGLAEEFGIDVMLEFIGWAKQINNIKIAGEIVCEADCPNGGLLVDTFHFVKRGSTIDDLKQVPMDKIFLVHINDSKPLPMEIKKQSRGFRFFPGEGEAPLKKIVQCFVENGYKNYYCIEIFNESYWAMDPEIVLKKSKNSMENLFV